MKKLVPSAVACAIVSVLFSSCRSTPPPVDMEAAMARMMEAGQLGPHHEHLARFVGEWDCAMQSWMEPDLPPDEMSGVARYELLFDGRYLRQTFESEFMGQPFQGIGFMGYDNARERYWTTWMDSMSTFMIPQATGQCSDDGRAMELVGSWYNPFMEREQHDRHVVTVVDDDRIEYDMYVSWEGQPEYLSMHLVYTRK